MLTGEREARARHTLNSAASSDTPTTKSSASLVKASKPPTQLGLDNFRGKWRYRFKVRGQPYGEVTDLEAVPENILKAQALKEAHRADIIKGKAVVRQMRMPIDKAVAEFNVWYRSEHPRGGKCKWATSLMSSFQFYLERLRLPLDKLTPGELERFKMWRRENDIHDNTLHKQMLLIRSFCAYGRKNGWIKGDPFAKGEDIEVKIPSEQESTAMRVLSLEEEARYLNAARLESIDLFDVATIMKEQGPRPDEVMSLQQSHVDLFNRHFTIWDNSAEGKSKSAHRKLKMTEDTFRVFKRRLSKPGMWVFPSPRNDGPRTTLQKSHEYATRGRKNKQGEYEGGCGIECRLYDMRHTFATRYALAGGLLPVLSKILGHTDLAMLNKYVHPSQEDMDRGMEWFSSRRPASSDLAEMLVGFEDGKTPETGGVTGRPVTPFVTPFEEKRAKKGGFPVISGQRP